MTSRVVYLCHPVSAPDAAGIRANIERTLRWLHWLVVNTVHAICAPWLAYVQSLLEETHRERGLTDDLAMLERCDVLVMVGPRVSAGMAIEAEHARAHGIPVVDLTDLAGAHPLPATAWDAQVRRTITAQVDTVPSRTPLFPRAPAPRPAMQVTPPTTQALARRRKAARR